MTRTPIGKKLATPTSCRSARARTLQRARSCSTPMRASPRSMKHTPKRRTPSKTPIRTSGDRFIPLRSGSMTSDPCMLGLMAEGTEETNTVDITAAQEEYTQTLKDSLLAQPEGKVLAFKQKAPEPQNTQSKHRVLYSHHTTKTRATDQKARRYIPQLPTKILDAPDIIDDYYLNLLDWSSANVLAIALSRTVYLWNASSGEIDVLLETPSEESYVSSLRWMADGSHLAVGMDDGCTQLWSVAASKRIRTMRGHSHRVSSLSWNVPSGGILSSGGQDNIILNHDVRQRESVVATLRGHDGEVCGLEWSPDGTQLASGGNDNRLCIWDAERYSRPRHCIERHTAAVKALAWCPHRPHLLASGGGTADRNIRFWNTSNGMCVKEVDTKSQVCALKWSTNHKDELVSSHGYSQNQLCVWQYPQMSKITELSGHSARVLHLAQSPDGETVASAAGDETLRFWKIFEKSGCVGASSSTSKAASPCGGTKRSIRGVHLR